MHVCEWWGGGGEREGPGLWFIEGVQVLTEGGDDTLILVGVLAEDILRNRPNAKQYQLTTYSVDMYKCRSQKHYKAVYMNTNA